MRRESHVRFCERARVRFPRATRLVLGFEHEAEAKRFLEELRTRLQEYSLSLHPDKTRLIEFGRHAAHGASNAVLANRRLSPFWVLRSSAGKHVRDNSRFSGRPEVTACGRRSRE